MAVSVEQMSFSLFLILVLYGQQTFDRRSPCIIQLTDRAITEEIPLRVQNLDTTNSRSWDFPQIREKRIFIERDAEA
ncbi:hypothetical protein TNCT_553811 [Trichonephila clavata]|uniref:Uncharacterized protein n=1 Tax=Trichonephila clavata TaxID=2740835 RepID=A0A8X6HIH5_TRICU|nr:hypothetical protein TNCT_553811 [Trichonephila clavata]